MIFDGFPRTAEQAEALDALLAERGTPLDMVVELRVADDEVMRRLTGRGRSDDTPEADRRALAIVLESNATACWTTTVARGFWKRVDGQGAVDEVFARIEAAIERRTSQAARLRESIPAWSRYDRREKSR